MRLLSACLIFFLWPRFILGDDELTHHAAHFGLSFSISTACGAIAEKNFSRNESLALCAVSTLLLGAGKEVWDHEHGETFSENLSGLEWDSLGVISSAVTIRFGF